MATRRYRPSMGLSWKSARTKASRCPRSCRPPSRRRARTTSIGSTRCTRLRAGTWTRWWIHCRHATSCHSRSRRRAWRDTGGTWRWRRCSGMIRIANGQGFWGDWLEAPVRLVEQGPLDFLTLDYLAEVTMSILQKQKQTDANLGYARDFPPLIGRIATRMRERGVLVIANAGGVNPVACARQVRAKAPDLKVAVVLGDDVYHRLDELTSSGEELRNMETGEPLAAIRDRV